MVYGYLFPCCYLEHFRFTEIRTCEKTDELGWVIGVNPVSGLPLIPTLRMRGVIPPLPLCFMAWLERPETISPLIS